MVTQALIKKGNRHQCPGVTLEQRIALIEAPPPLEELNTVSQKKHVWFTDGSAMVVKGKSSVKYAANNLKEEIIQGLLDPPNILSPL